MTCGEPRPRLQFRARIISCAESRRKPKTGVKKVMAGFWVSTGQKSGNDFLTLALALFSPVPLERVRAKHCPDLISILLYRVRMLRKWLWIEPVKGSGRLSRAGPGILTQQLPCDGPGDWKREAMSTFLSVRSSLRYRRYADRLRKRVGMLSISTYGKSRISSICSFPCICWKETRCFPWGF
jgi:hypothetical protein